MILVKFETKSNRVKGLSFHPTRPWLICSLHSGSCQLWDYRMGTLIDRFDEHDGPVRGVHFHMTQPLFVTGGDDYKIKVWNYKTRRCLFTLLGHLDYIRTVAFHHEYPWIVSASDDQTIRIWNWQSRTCVSVLTGHNHYVMCAAFHPKEDLIVSASLDQTVRIWDIGELRRKSLAPRGGGMGGGSGGLGGDALSNGGGPGGLSDGPRIPQVNVDLFGGGDAAVKYVLEGHDRGVNWACFHPTLPLVASGADDRTVKLWRMGDAKAWEVDTLRGHVNNVSCVVFHAQADVLVSDSEDRSLRVWDLSKRVGVQTFRREHDRFWILAVHPNINLLAAGHDSGLLVFKLARERPAAALRGDVLYYVRDRAVRARDLATGRDAVAVALRRNPAAARDQAPRTLSVSPAGDAVLVQSDVDGGTYDLYPLPHGAAGGGGSSASASASASTDVEPRRGAASASAFVGRNRFATLDRTSGVVSVRDLSGDATRRVQSPLPGADALFPAGPGTVLLRAEDRVALLDVQRRAAVAELATPPVRHVVWSEDGERVALLAKHAVVLADRRLGSPATVHETVRVKSGAWDPEGVFVYSTLNHLKYALPNGDSGTLRTLPDPLYVVRVRNGDVHALDRRGQPRTLRVDPAEYRFKLALDRRQYGRALAVIRAGALCGQAIVGYLRDKGYPEVALHFAQEPRLRLELALACGDVEVALEAAQALDEPGVWARLGESALRAGNHAVVEFCYQRTRAYEKLAVLYAATGATDKLAKMAKIAEMRGDARARFHVALLTGDAAERVRTLEAAGQPALAYVAAAAAGLEDTAQSLAAKLEADAAERAEREAELLADGQPPAPATPNPLPQPARDQDVLAPPAVLVRADNWPLLESAMDAFEALAAGDDEAIEAAGRGEARAEREAAARATAQAKAKAKAKAAGLAAADAADDDDQAAGWGDEDLGDLEGLGEEGAADEDGLGGWDVDDLDLPLDVGSPRVGGAKTPAELAAAAEAPAGVAADADASQASGWAAPSQGPPLDAAWRTRAVLPAEHAAAGAFDVAARLLERQLGIVRVEPLREAMLDLRAASGAYEPLLPGWGAADVPLDAGWRADAPAGQELRAPRLLYGLDRLRELQRLGRRAVTEGKFGEAQRLFDDLLHLLPLAAADDESGAQEIAALLADAKEYALGVRVELARREAQREDAKRGVELAAYFTHVKLEPVHLRLALRSAMSLAFRLKCNATCATLARRLLDAGLTDPKQLQQAKAVLAACERAPADAVALEYDPRTPFELCAASLTPIYKGDKFVQDPYTNAHFKPEYEGTVSTIGNISRVGAIGTGLVAWRGAGQEL